MYVTFGKFLGTSKDIIEDFNKDTLAHQHNKDL